MEDAMDWLTDLMVCEHCENADGVQRIVLEDLSDLYLCPDCLWDYYGQEE